MLLCIFLKTIILFHFLQIWILSLKTTCSYSYNSFICKFSKNALINGLNDGNIKSMVKTVLSFLPFQQWIICNHSAHRHYLVNLVPLKFHQKTASLLLSNMHYNLMPDFLQIKRRLRENKRLIWNYSAHEKCILAITRPC